MHKIISGTQRRDLTHKLTMQGLLDHERGVFFFFFILRAVSLPEGFYTGYYII